MIRDGFRGIGSGLAPSPSPSPNYKKTKIKAKKKKKKVFFVNWSLLKKKALNHFLN
jgi:hypothetical protein